MFDDGTIETLKHMLSFGSNKRDIILAATKKSQITEEFLREFSDVVDEEIFSSSYMLSNKMINNHPDLFSFTTWLESDVKDPMIVFEEDFAYKNMLTPADLNCNIIAKIGKYLSKEQLDMYIGMCLGDDPNEVACRENLLRFSLPNMSEEQIAEYIFHIPYNSFFKYFKNGISTDIVRKSLEKTPNLCLSRILSIAMLTNNISFVKEILNSDREYAFSSSYNYESLWKTKFVNDLPEDILIKAFDLASRYEPNVISYSVLSRALQMKDFEEEDAVYLVEPCRRNNLIKALYDYADIRGYETLKLACVMQ